MQQFLEAKQFTELPLPHFRGCFLSGGRDILYMCWVLLMTYDTGSLIMILIPGIAVCGFLAFLSPTLSLTDPLSRTDRAGGGSELLKVVYRDGAVYYAFVCIISVINVIVVVILPVGWFWLTSNRRLEEMKVAPDDAVRSKQICEDGVIYYAFIFHEHSFHIPAEVYGIWLTWLIPVVSVINVIVIV
ncbi:hypothetical protein VNI00_008646 [Paramarasmius palmivorus]|uniref:Uncharacterized protein n=1 Tax=Paramarasmius palmivorus TaxID=297713 RepID=A0AAW0CV96_9AGAR